MPKPAPVLGLGSHSGPRAPAHKMDDFEPISILKPRGGPIISGNDAAIAFDGDPISFHAELLDKLPESR